MKKKLGKYKVSITAGPARINVYGSIRAKAKRNAKAFIKKYLRNIANPNYSLGIGGRGNHADEYLPGLYASWISAKLEAQKASKRLGKKVRVLKSRN